MVLIDQENRQIPLVAAAIFNSDGEHGVQVSFATANSQDDKEAAQEVFTNICTDAALLNFNSQLVLMDENTKLQMNRNDPILDIPRYFIGMAVTEKNNLVITNIKEVDDYLACCTCLGMVVKNTEKPASNYLVPRLMKHMTEKIFLLIPEN